MRQVFLDTETTGLDPNQGHRIIEIAAVEFNNRQSTNKKYHSYINPEREIDAAAEEVHGLSLEFLQDKPLFQDVAQDFLNFIQGAELIIHNAPFDVGFINAELGRLGLAKLEDNEVHITDSLQFAKDLRPGQRNSLDALCRAYDIDNSERTLHGALLDAQLLGEVFIAMTRGQEAISMDFVEENSTLTKKDIDFSKLKVIKATTSEVQAHESYLERIQAADY
jgi:DNA polymerase-3 subunit epsilon